jgi:hypothetical protein
MESAPKPALRQELCLIPDDLMANAAAVSNISDLKSLEKSAHFLVHARYAFARGRRAMINDHAEFSFKIPHAHSHLTGSIIIDLCPSWPKVKSTLSHGKIAATQVFFA